MSDKKYNYRPITINFDMDDADDVKLVKWLEKNKSKNNNFSDQIRRALKYFIEQQTKDDDTEAQDLPLNLNP
jgi:hypothetical protein